MGLNDLLANDQSKSRPLAGRFSGNEQIKNFRQDFWGNPGSIVGDFDGNAGNPVPGSRSREGADFESPFAFAGVNRVVLPPFHAAGK